MKQFCVYILTNQTNKVLYTGVTSNLPKRIFQHKNKSVEGFTEKYNVNRLVYFELHENAESAILREKQIKKWRREKKVFLINTKNNDYSAWLSYTFNNHTSVVDRDYAHFLMACKSPSRNSSSSSAIFHKALFLKTLQRKIIS